MPRRLPPVRSFAPELLALYSAAHLERQAIGLSSKREAVALRARLHLLRQAMRIEQHHLLNIAEGVVIRIRELENRWFLIAETSDAKFVEALQASGITVEEAQVPLLQPPLEPQSDPIKQFLDPDHQPEPKEDDPNAKDEDEDKAGTSEH